MKKFLKCLFCFLFIFVLLLCSTLSVFAYDVNLSYTELQFSYWKIDYVEFLRDGEFFVVDFPTKFFEYDDGFINTCTLQKDGQTYTVEFSIVMSDDSGLLRIVSSMDFESLTIHFADSIIPYDMYDPASGAVFGNRFGFVLNSSEYFNTRLNFSLGKPDFTYLNNQIVGRAYTKYTSPTFINYRLDTPAGLVDDSNGSSAFSCVPNNNFLSDYAVGYPITSYGYLNVRFLHCFDHSFTVDVADGFTSNLIFVFDLITETNFVNFNFYDFYTSYFPGYYLGSGSDDGTGVFAGFGEFIVTTLDGFLQWELLPNIMIVDMFMMIVGIGLVVLLLKFFSGG